MAKGPKAPSSEPAKVLFENDKVKVVELRVKRGTKMGNHSHPSYLTYALTPLEYKSTAGDGKTESRKVKKGGTDWSDGESHSVEFLRAARAIVVEVK